MAAAGDATALEVAEVVKRYGRTEALKGVSMSMAPGLVVGLLGPNGSGKSTLTKIACGLVHASDGAVRVFGHPAGSRAARRRTGYLAELFRFPPYLTGDELLRLHQRLTGSGGGAAERRALLGQVQLDDAADRRLEGYSKGMQQRLGLAQALVGAPDLLLLDEPTSALDPVARTIVRDLLVAQRDRGASVMVSSHLLSEVQDLCDHVVVVLHGEKVLDRSMAELTAASGVVVRTADGAARTFDDVGPGEVPDLVRRLVGEGARITAVEPAGTTLEQAYLRVVHGVTT